MIEARSQEQVAVAVLEEENPTAAAIKRLVPALVLYSCLCGYFIFAYRYSINTDATSYISIAQKYARGEFAGAVNAIWQPLFSWLMAPFIFSGLDPLLSAKLVQILAGMLALVSCGLLALKMPIEAKARQVMVLTLVPVVLRFTFFTLTPDLLFASLVTLYFSVILDPAYPSGRQPLACGVICGLAFLAKAYALPFFLAHFALMNLFHGWRQGETKAVMRSSAAGFAAFFLIVAAWSMPLSFKYHGFTVCKAFEFNAAASLSGDWPISVRFRPPANPTALSAWEDPSTLPMEKMPRLDAPAIARKELKTVFSNLRDSLGMLKRFSPLSIAALMLALYLCCAPGGLRGPRSEPGLAGLLFSCLLLVAGYLPVNLEARYIWAGFFLVVVIAFVLVSKLLREAPGIPKDALLLAVSLSFFAGPLFLMKYGPTENQAALERIRARLASNGVTGRIAADSNWEDTLYLAFFLKGSYYGEQDPALSGDEVRAQLEKYGIEYFFVWREGPPPSFLKGLPELSGGVDPRLRVYRLR